MKKLLLSLIVITGIAKQTQAQITIDTVAGNGLGATTYTCCYSGDGGPATAAGLNMPNGVAIDLAGNVFIADTGNDVIRKVDIAGIISTIAGTGTIGYSGDGGPASTAELNGPNGVAVDAAGNIYIADTYNNAIRMVNSNGIISTFGYGFQYPAGVAVDAAGNVFVADTYNQRIAKINTSGSAVTTIAGTGIGIYSGDGGLATNAGLRYPNGVAIDAAGNIYIADNINKRVRKVNTNGIISTLAGTGTAGYSGDGGPATAAELSYPTSVAVDAFGNIYIADNGNLAVRKVDANGIITSILGAGFFNSPYGVSTDAAGNLYVADQMANYVYKLSGVATIGIKQFTNKEQINIYPNPTTNNLQVSFAGNSEGSTLVMTNMLGNVVKQMSFNTQHSTISVADVEAGVYFITVTSGASISTQKIIVSK